MNVTATLLINTYLLLLLLLLRLLILTHREFPKFYPTSSTNGFVRFTDTDNAPVGTFRPSMSPSPSIEGTRGRKWKSGSRKVGHQPGETRFVWLPSYLAGFETACIPVGNQLRRAIFDPRRGWWAFVQPLPYIYIYIFKRG